MQRLSRLAKWDRYRHWRRRLTPKGDSMSSIVKQLLGATGAVALTGPWVPLLGRTKVGLGGTVAGATMAGSITIEVDAGDGVARALPVDGSAYTITVEAAGAITDALEPVAFRQVRAKWAPTEGNTEAGTVVLWASFA